MSGYTSFQPRVGKADRPIADSGERPKRRGMMPINIYLHVLAGESNVRTVFKNGCERIS